MAGKSRKKPQSYRVDPKEIFEGVRFSTDFEEDCLAIAEPDFLGNFDGIDSEGVKVTFFMAMVKEVTGMVHL
jgi:hypothetical protein